MRLGKTEVETLRLNGWGVGDVLEGYENGRSDRIWITRLGNEKFGCRIARECNGVWEEEKFNMTLRYREWAKVDHIETTDTSRLEWDGISWPPPVNSLVESFAANGDGIECEVLAVRGDKVIACTTDTHMAGWITEEGTRPIRTPEQKAEDAMVKELPSAMQSDPIRMVCRELYRAGYRKQQ